MQLLKLNKEATIHLRSEGTRYGFRHLAELYRNGYSTGVKAKACYHNRTWERFEFESVLESLVDRLDDKEAKQLKKILSKGKL